MKKEGIVFKGFLYAGIILKDGKPYVLEFNARMVMMMSITYSKSALKNIKIILISLILNNILNFLNNMGNL